MSAKTVQVVTMRGSNTMTYQQFMAEFGSQQVGTKTQNPPGRIQFKEEMVGMPIIASLVGPMYGGPGICRYEDAEANNFYST